VIPAVILAAGRSTRMGRPKALLTLPPDGATFVARVVLAVRDGGVPDALVVGRPDDRPLRDEIDRLAAVARVQFIENRRADAGQLSSVIAGLNAADRPGVRGILVAPADQPLIRPATIAALLAAFSPATPIVRATHAGRHGHPVIFGRTMFDALRAADPDCGARAVVRTHPVLDVEVDDPGVLKDIDTPGDYERLVSDSEP